MRRWRCAGDNLSAAEASSGAADTAHPAPDHRLTQPADDAGAVRRAQLNALAGQLPAAAGLSLSGVVTVNGRPQERARVRQAYVQQQDLFYSQLTVRCGAARRSACRPAARRRSAAWLTWSRGVMTRAPSVGNLAPWFGNLALW